MEAVSETTQISREDETQAKHVSMVEVHGGSTNNVMQREYRFIVAHEANYVAISSCELYDDALREIS